MSNCIICGGDVSMLSQKRSMDGIICSKCMTKIPHVLHGTISLYDSEELRRIIEYEDEMKKKPNFDKSKEIKKRKDKKKFKYKR